MFLFKMVKTESRCRQTVQFGNPPNLTCPLKCWSKVWNKKKLASRFQIAVTLTSRYHTSFMMQTLRENPCKSKMTERFAYTRKLLRNKLK